MKTEDLKIAFKQMGSHYYDWKYISELPDGVLIDLVITDYDASRFDQ